MRILQLTKTVMALVAVAAALGAAACGDVARTGRSPAFLIVDSLDGGERRRTRRVRHGPRPPTSSTLVRRSRSAAASSLVPTIFDDPGRASSGIALQEPRHRHRADGAVGAQRHHADPLPRRLRARRRPQHPGRGRALRLRRRRSPLTIPEDGDAIGFFELVRHPGQAGTAAEQPAGHRRRAI